MRVALGLTYLGRYYEGWQSQSSGLTIQDKLEQALQQFTLHTIRTHCAGRTDARVHALMQVVHFDSPVARDNASWVRGLNSFLPADIAVQWATVVNAQFDARRCAVSRKYIYMLLESGVRPSLQTGRVGWSFKPLSEALMIAGAQYLIGTHDFTSFRAAECQALSPVKTLHAVRIQRAHYTAESELQAQSALWRFEFEGNAFLHHMIRNIMGCLLYVGQGRHPPNWIQEVLLAKSRESAAPTFSAEGLYFAGPSYEAQWNIPVHTPALNCFVL